jgi:hypothetical protein
VKASLPPKDKTAEEGKPSAVKLRRVKYDDKQMRPSKKSYITK